MTFTVTIETGNDAMQTPADIGFSLYDIGYKFINGLVGDLNTESNGKLMDHNGNTVGNWSCHA
jgi:hypothetical protein